MKGLIFYFSGTGTTKLAVQYISANLFNVEFDFHDMNDKNVPNLEKYDLLGFASYAQGFDPPQYVEKFIKSLKKVKSKYVFIFNTYGFINGNTLNKMGKWLKTMECKVIAGFALHTPESSPIMIHYKITSENSPNDKEMREFNKFIKELDLKINKIKFGESIEEISIKENKIFIFTGEILKRSSLSTIGEKHVDTNKCIKCKLCEERCPYNAIFFKGEYPKFDEMKCKSCFICYNKCPVQAIKSNKYKNERYNKPDNKIIGKLNGETFK